jgi:ParB-like chromosome segregation protein Spo0J
MAVQIQDILALLPELFPGVQSLPLKNVRPDPENPGPPLTDQAIQDMADNIAARGLVNPIKVQGDKANLFAEGIQPHSDNSRLRADGQPWKVEDFNYVILGGERRYRATDRLHWATIPGFILNPSEEEAVEINYLDNDVRDRGWWAGYQTLEKLIKANPTLTQRQVGTRLKMNKDKVTRALGLLPLLNPEARALIVRVSDNSNKGNKQISELAVAQLANLGPESAFKPGVKKAGDESQKLWPYPAIPAETQDLVRCTLAVAIDKELTEAGVRGLVAYVQEGHQPEEFGSQGLGTPKPEKVKGPAYEFKKIPVNRTRVDRITATMMPHPDEVERRVLIMQECPNAMEIMARSLSEEEKSADPDNDYELVDRAVTLMAAKKLGWPLLNARVYAVDEFEAFGICNDLYRHTRTRSWFDTYDHITKFSMNNPDKTLAEVAILFEEDPVVINQVLAAIKLLNESAKKSIRESIFECHEGMIDNGGYRFTEYEAIPLVRLGGISKNLLETQQIVESVVKVAIENQAWAEDVEGLVDCVLAGNAPDKYFEKEA